MRVERLNDSDRLRGTQDPLLAEQRRRQEDIVRNTREEMTERARTETRRAEQGQQVLEREREQVAGPTGPQAPQRTPGTPEGSQLDVYA